MAVLKTGQRTGSRPQPPEAGARSASLEPGRSPVYFQHSCSVGRDGEVLKLIWVEREQKFFCKGDWTAGIRLIRFKKPGFSKLRSVTESRPRPYHQPATAHRGAANALKFSLLCGHSGHRRTCCGPNPVAIDPTETFCEPRRS